MLSGTEARARLTAGATTATEKGSTFGEAVPAFAKRPSPSNGAGRPVLVTTEFRGVFFGYLKSRDGSTVILTNARNCIYWSAKTGGFGGLATVGPQSGSRIGERISAVELLKVTSIADCEPAAVETWEKTNVYRG